MKTMTNTQLEMGKISNLITDMTIRRHLSLRWLVLFGTPWW